LQDQKIHLSHQFFDHADGKFNLLIFLLIWQKHSSSFPYWF